MNRALACLALLLAGAGQYGLGEIGWPAGLLWIAALAIFFTRLRSGPGAYTTAAEVALPPASEAIAFAAIFALAVFFRLYRLDLIPSGLNHDVAWNGLYALRILGGEPYTPYTAEAWGRETTMLYLQALGIQLFGVEVPAMIYPAVLAGVLLVPVFYLWLRELFGVRLALVSTFLLGASGWHLVFSRIGWRAVLQPLVSTLAYWAFARAWRHRGTLAFCAAGAAAAAALYTYNAARLLPALFPLFALYTWILAEDRTAGVARYRRGALDMTVCFAAVVAPMAWYAFRHWWAWEQRASATYFLDGHTVWDNLRALGAVYLTTANGDDFFVDTPVLEAPVALFFVFGFADCLARWRQPRAGFLLLGWLIAALPAFFSTPNANRMIGTLPFAYAFAGIGVCLFFRLFAVSETRPSAAFGFLAAVALAAIVATWSQYFGPWRRELAGFYPETTVLGRYARDLLPHFDVWIGGRNFPRETLDYLTYRGGDPRERSYHWLDDVSTAPLLDLQPPADGRGIAFLLSSTRTSGLVFEQLRRTHPAAEVVDLKDWTRDDEVFARALLLSPSALSAAPFPAEAASLPSVSLADTARGSGPGQLLDPRGVAVDREGNVYVADTGNHRVQVFGPDGRLAKIYGEHGATPGAFDEPSDVAIDAAGNVLVVDTWNHRVQKLDRNGFPLALYTPPDGFFGPRAIAVGEGRIYVSDTGNHRIAVFDADGISLGSLGFGEGGAAGQLRNPMGVAVAGDGDVWVVDAGNRRLQVFAPDGAFRTAIPINSWAGDELRESYLAADASAVLLTDPPAGKVWRVSADGQVVEVASRLRYPGGITVTPNGFLVSERDAGHVARFDR